MGKAMKPNEKRLLANYVGLEGLTSDELDQLFALMEEAVRNADQLPTLHCDDEPALTFFVPQVAVALGLSDDAPPWPLVEQEPGTG
jgi:hypothetical protein